MLIVKSYLIGLWIGFLPGIGAGLANLIAYVQAKSSYKTPEQFGTNCKAKSKCQRAYEKQIQMSELLIIKKAQKDFDFSFQPSVNISQKNDGYILPPPTYAAG